MKKLLSILAAGVCVILLVIGTLAALWMGFLGIAVFFAAAFEALWDLALFALFCLVTVALPSVCCFAGLLFLIDRCLNRTPPARPDLERPLTLMAIVSVLIAVAMFWSAAGGAFTAVCITADVLYVLFIILYLSLKRGKTHDPNRP